MRKPVGMTSYTAPGVALPGATPGRKRFSVPNVGATSARHSRNELGSARLGPGPSVLPFSGGRVDVPILGDGAEPVAIGRSYTGPGDGVVSLRRGDLDAFSNAANAAERRWELVWRPHELDDSYDPGPAHGLPRFRVRSQSPIYT